MPSPQAPHPSALIVAAATVPAGGGRAIVRIAGDGLDAVLAALVVPLAPGVARPGEQPRLVRALLHPDVFGGDWGGVPIEILHWPGPAGPTGGPLAELQLPGAPLLADAVVAEVCSRGARLARGGEFSLRAFLAGRLDVLQAEAVLAVVDARTPAELSAALDRLAGGIGRALERTRQEMLDLVADVEAAIDFADETTPDAVPVVAVWDDLAARIGRLVAALADVSGRLAARETAGAEQLPRVVLVGQPNIGKSSLFNALLGREAALVADEAGTTRDWLAARLDHPDGDAACRLIDIAGIEEGLDGVATALTHAAAERARDEIARADVLVVCRDAAQAGAAPPAPHAPRATRIDAVTRSDLQPAAGGGGSAIITSSRDGTGIATLRRAILAAAAAAAADRAPATLRMRVGVGEARQALEAAANAVAAARAGAGDEAIVAGLLHRAIDMLGDVTGAVLGTDLLDRIFSRHCVGK